MPDIKAYSFTSTTGITYYLHTKELLLRGGRRQTIYYFRRDVVEETALSHIPDGKRIKENARTGLPMLTR